MKKSDFRGFTFLELLIGLTILGVVAMIVYSALNLSVRAAERGEVRSTENQRARAALALIARHLKSAYPLTLQVEGERIVYFFGEPSELSFIAATGRPEVGGLEKVTYFLREDREGRRSLWVRTSAPTLPADLLDKREGGLRQETQVLPEVESVAWEYLRDTQSSDGGKVQRQEEWSERWDGSKDHRLPAAVRFSWRAHLGELPYEWRIEVPINVFFPPPDQLTAPGGGGAGTRARRFRDGENDE
ncbi:MAG: PulJ/GspJ family protein [Candidatus Binatia bacterium]